MGQPIIASDVKQDQRHFPVIDKTTGLSTHDMIALPLKSWEGDPIGVLEVINKKDGTLNQDDLDILIECSILLLLHWGKTSSQGNGFPLG